MENLKSSYNFKDIEKKWQKKWEGKSCGTGIDFEIENLGGKISNVLIVHGWCGTSDGNWFKWFKENYKDKYDIIIPDMPNSEKPKIDEWICEIEKHKNKFNKNTILIGHSLGCPTICKFLEKNKIKIKKLILVAPSPISYNKKDFEIIRKLKVPKESENSLKKYLEDLEINFSECSTLVNEVVLYLSKDDPYVADYNYRLKEYALLTPEIKLFENKGHFNSETGIIEFHELLDVILNDK